VDTGSVLHTLLEKGLIKIMGRKELPGRPIVYGTTKAFLELFSLNSVSDLPKLQEIQPPPAPEEISAQEISPQETSPQEMSKEEILKTETEEITPHQDLPMDQGEE
jgi:segregation and condensation protein B